MPKRNDQILLDDASDAKDKEKTIRLPAWVTPDFDGYISWTENDYKPGELAVAALMYFWQMSPVEQIETLNKVKGYRSRRRARGGSFVPNESYAEVLRQMEARSAPNGGEGTVAAGTGPTGDQFREAAREALPPGRTKRGRGRKGA